MECAVSGNWSETVPALSHFIVFFLQAAAVSPSNRPNPFSFGGREMIFALVKFDARTARHFAIVLACLLRVVVEFFCHLAADFPQPFQSVIMFRLHRLFQGVGAAWPARAFPSQAARSRAGCAAACWRWRCACNSMSPIYHSGGRRRGPNDGRRPAPQRA